MINPTFILRSLKGRCHSNQFWGRIGEIGLPHLHSSHCLSETLEYRNAYGHVNSSDESDDSTASTFHLQLRFSNP